MEDTEKQAVVDEQPDDQAVPESEGADAQDDGDDLEAILSEFDSGEDAKSTPETAADDDTKKKLLELEQKIEAQQFRADMEDVVNKVRGDIPSDVFDDVEVEAWIDAQARRDTRLQKAWSNRHNDPKGFDRVVGGLNKTFAKKFSKLPDQNATEDREAVSQAVRGSSGKAPEGGDVPDFASMNDAEARAAMKKMGIQDPGF